MNSILYFCQYNMLTITLYCSNDKLLMELSLDKCSISIIDTSENKERKNDIRGDIFYRDKNDNNILHYMVRVPRYISIFWGMVGTPIFDKLKNQKNTDGLKPIHRFLDTKKQKEYEYILF